MHFLDWMKNNLLFIYSTNILVRLPTVNMKNFLTPKNPKMCDPTLVTVWKMQRHYRQSSRENATPSSGTSPFASYKEVTPPPSPLHPFYTWLLSNSVLSVVVCHLQNVSGKSGWKVNETNLFGVFPAETFKEQRNTRKSRTVFPDGMFQTVIRVPFLQGHTSFRLLRPISLNGTDLCKW